MKQNLVRNTELLGFQKEILDEKQRTNGEIGGIFELGVTGDQSTIGAHFKKSQG